MCVTDKYIIVAVIGELDTDLTRLYVFNKNTNVLSTDFVINPIKDRSFVHANSLTYNSKLNQVIICSLEKTLWVLDASTLNTVTTITLPFNCSAIAYDSKNDRYIMKGAFDIHVCDNSFSEIYNFSIPSVTFTSQGIEYNNDMIFVPFYDSVGSTNVGVNNMIFVYTLDGKLVKTFLFGSIGEIEDLAYMDGRFLANFNKSGTIMVYTVNLLPQTTFTESDALKSNELFLNYSLVPSGSDLNSYVLPGVYKINGTGIGATLLNCPTTFNAKLKVEYIQNTNYLLQTVISRDNLIYTRTFDGSIWSSWDCISNNDTGWLILPLASGITTNTLVRSVPMYRRIGKHVFVSGSVNATTDASIRVITGTLPTGFRPISATPYKINPSSGQKLNRTFIDPNTGNVNIEYCWDLTTGSKVITNTWHDITIDFWID
jgi:hypothetical protein